MASQNKDTIVTDTIEIKLADNSKLKAQVVELEKRIDALENYLVKVRYCGNPTVEPFVGEHMQRKQKEYLKRHPMNGECSIM